MLLRREAFVRELRARFAADRWRPSGFRPVFLHDPKPRVIAWGPLEDRIALHAIARTLERALLPGASPSAFACKKRAGTHRARLRLLHHLRRASWFVHLDLRSYFPSIDLDVLRDILRRHIRDRRFLALIDRVLAAGAGFYNAPKVRRFARIDPDWPARGRGLPIGAATSQTLACHAYLWRFDHWVDRELRPAGYVRYVDDLFLFEHDRARLESLRGSIAEWLGRERGLRLKSPTAQMRSCLGTLHGLGARITRAGVAPAEVRIRHLRAEIARKVWDPVYGEGDADFDNSLRTRVAGNFLP